MEEDLANIFGRGLIPPGFEQDFKEVMTRNTKIQPTSLYNGCKIVLVHGPAASVKRAIVYGREYISTVIQLSFLGWTHDRVGLASALVERMESRRRAKVVGAVPHPGSEGMMKSLESCSAQKSSFD